MASSLALLLVEVLEVVLTLPGDFAGGDRSTKELISTLAVIAEPMASPNRVVVGTTESRAIFFHTHC